MATISSIGSGKTYTSIQSWHDAFTTGGWEGECYNNTGANYAPASLTGKATNATDYIKLRCATGESFKDNANKLTNALRYNISNGVGIAATAYVTGLNILEPYVTVTGLQVKAFNNNAYAVGVGHADGNIVIEYCIMDAGTNIGGVYPVNCSAALGQNDLTMRNCLLIAKTSNEAFFSFHGQKFYNCTFVRVTSQASSGNAIKINYSAGTAINCAAFGFNGVVTGSTLTSTTCMTDIASPPSGWTGGKTYASQFENTGTTEANRDFRTKSGADLINAGTTDTTNIPNGDDIVGTARSTWDIGVWEVASSAPVNSNMLPGMAF